MTPKELSESLEWLETRLRHMKNGTMSETAWGFLFARLAAMRLGAKEIDNDQ